MNLDSPWAILSGLFIGLLGMALFVYGRRQERPDCLFAGVLISVAPIFVHSLVLLWAATGLVGAGLYARKRFAA